MSLSRLTDLEVRLYKLTTISHLSIGAGEGSVELSAVDNPIIRALIYDGTDEPRRIPYIPASSIHGVVRSWVEKAIKSQEGELVTVEDIASVNEEKRFAAKRGLQLDENAPDEDLLEKWEGEEIYKSVCNLFDPSDRCERFDDANRWKKDFLKALGRTIPCKACEIFGHMGQRGRVRFTHAYPTNENPELDIITRVAIDRLTGAADEGKLFDLEAVPPGVEFYAFTILENLENAQKENFNLGIRAFQLQLATLGGHSTVGFGMVEMEEVFALNIKPTIFDVEIETIKEETLKAEGYTPVQFNDQPIDLNSDKYPEFFRILTLRKEGKLYEKIREHVTCRS